MASLSVDTAQSKHDSDLIADAINRLMDDFDARPGIASQNEITTSVTSMYLDEVGQDHFGEPSTLERHLLALHNSVVKQENGKATTALERLPLAKRLTSWQVARILLRLHDVVRIVFSGPKRGAALAVYATEGPDEGTYVLDETELRRLARRYNTHLSLRDFSEVVAVLQEEAPTVTPCRDRDLIGVNNGIFHYKSKVLMQFDPSIILLAKVRVDYVDSPTCPTIHRPDGTTWDVETWMESLSDDPERVSLGWHLLGAVVRPNVGWNKAVMFYNEAGNNGKGTFMSLCRNLVGADSWGALSIADFEDKFRLPEIVNKSAFGADENAVGGFTEKMANFKATITGDAIMIERKHKDPFWYQPRGLMIQCINSLPKSKDVSESYYRRLLFWRFDKSFHVGEDEAIKADYLQREDVLQYFLWRVLNLPDYYKLPEPASSKEVLAEFKESNDPVREFWSEVEQELKWDLLPQEFLHDLFMAWSERANPRSGGLKKREFYSRLKAIVAEDGRWQDGQHGTSTRMDSVEPLVANYSLSWWPGRHPYERTAGMNRSGLKPKYRGLLRRTDRQGALSMTDTADPVSPAPTDGGVPVARGYSSSRPARSNLPSESDE